jgi:hypothetical protein
MPVDTSPWHSTEAEAEASRCPKLNAFLTTICYVIDSQIRSDREPITELLNAHHPSVVGTRMFTDVFTASKPAALLFTPRSVGDFRPGSSETGKSRRAPVLRVGRAGLPPCQTAKDLRLDGSTKTAFAGLLIARPLC